MHFLYNLAIGLYYFLINIFSFFNLKAKKWVNGRAKQTIPNLKNKKVVWMHCSSLGEYEQGKPLLDKLKEEFNNYTFVLTFFSPSGFERIKSKNDADYILYLPIDLPSKSKEFINKINPSLAIFVKYDFWYNYLKVLNNKKINTIFISVILENKHRLFNPANRFLTNELKKVTKIFTQDIQTFDLLNKHGFSNIEIAGDTRIERAIEISKSKFTDQVIETYTQGNKKIFIAGSTWKKDIDLISKSKNQILKNHKIIIAPHEISKNQINYITEKFHDNTISLYSENDKNLIKSEILILDTIGILSKIYRFAHLVYIGGGFGTGIHNTLEPSAYLVPVIFGPKYRKFHEAYTLVNSGSFFSVKNSEQLNKILLSLESEENYQNATKGIRDFFQKNQGATEKIIRFLKSILK